MYCAIGWKFLNLEYPDWLKMHFPADIRRSKVLYKSNFSSDIGNYFSRSYVIILQ